MSYYTFRIDFFLIFFLWRDCHRQERSKGVIANVQASSYRFL